MIEGLERQRKTDIGAEGKGEREREKARDRDRDRQKEGKTHTVREGERKKN